MIPLGACNVICWVIALAPKADSSSLLLCSLFKVGRLPFSLVIHRPKRGKDIYLEAWKTDGESILEPSTLQTV